MTNQSSAIQAIQNLLETEVAKQNVELHEEIARLTKELSGVQGWQNLAREYDIERTQSIWHLKALLQSREHESAVHEFLDNRLTLMKNKFQL